MLNSNFNETECEINSCFTLVCVCVCVCVCVYIYIYIYIHTHLKSRRSRLSSQESLIRVSVETRWNFFFLPFFFSVAFFHQTRHLSFFKFARTPESSSKPLNSLICIANNSTGRALCDSFRASFLHLAGGTWILKAASCWEERRRNRVFTLWK